jgi:hypothetical protein
MANNMDRPDYPGLLVSGTHLDARVEELCGWTGYDTKPLRRNNSSLLRRLISLTIVCDRLDD